jgi:hypothetical protein
MRSEPQCSFGTELRLGTFPRWLGGLETWNVLMFEDTPFDAAKFLALSPKERAQLCRRLAHEARTLADADPKFAPIYSDLAGHWSELARQMDALEDQRPEA